MPVTQSPFLESKLPGKHIRRPLCLPTPWPQLIDRFLPAPPKKSITLPTFSIIHTTGSGEEIWKHISLCHSGHLWAHRLCSITTGLRAANMDYTWRKNNSWKPPDMCLMASPAYENPKCTDISAKCASKPQETAHSPSEARVAEARPQVHRKKPAYTLSCSLALEKRHMAHWDPH